MHVHPMEAIVQMSFLSVLGAQYLVPEPNTTPSRRVASLLAAPTVAEDIRYLTDNNCCGTVNQALHSFARSNQRSDIGAERSVRRLRLHRQPCVSAWLPSSYSRVDPLCRGALPCVSDCWATCLRPMPRLYCCRLLVMMRKRSVQRNSRHRRHQEASKKEAYVPGLLGHKARVRLWRTAGKRQQWFPRTLTIRHTHAKMKLEMLRFETATRLEHRSRLA